VPLSFFGDTLPEDFGWGREAGGVYGKEAPPVAAALLDASPWADSVVRGANGRPVLDTWYVQYYQEPRGLNLIVYPTRTNHRHAQMMEQLQWLMEEVGFDGAYIDQFALALGGSDSLTYGTWDGHTVDLDPTTGEVTRKYGIVGLLSAEARWAWVEYLLGKGKIVVANGEPAVNELQRLPVYRFMETQGYGPMSGDIPNCPNCARGQLASPIGLGHSFGYGRSEGEVRGGEFLMRTVIAHLRYGLLYYYYGAAFDADQGGYGPVNHMFPFTPVELHEGWIVGRERTITCVSGTFARPGGVAPEVHLFDARGLEKACTPQVERTENGYLVRLTLEDWREVAVVQ
jgi:hypothetical protein